MNLLASRNGRLLAFFLLYITEGLPLGFAAGAIAVYMRREGVSVDEMGLFLAALYAPWGIKWLFGPFVDLIGSNKIGHRRGWIGFAQIIMIVGLMASSVIDYTDNIALFTWAMVAVNGFCALQDVAIDALAVNTLKEEERGMANGLMFAGAYLGQALGGSGMLYIASTTGDLNAAFFVVAGMVAMVFVFVVLPMREEPSDTLPEHFHARAFTKSAVTYVREMVRSVFLSKSSIAALVLAILPASAMALGLALQAALAVELGFDDVQIANLGLVGALTAGIGSVAGGWISDRTGHRRTLAVYVLLTLIPTGFLAYQMQQFGWVMPVDVGAVDRVVPQGLQDAFWWATIVYGFFTGLTYGTRMAIFMSACNPKVAASQFTLFMAASNFAISGTSLWQGEVIVRLGYPTTLALDCVAGLLCLAVLPLVRPHQPKEPAIAGLPVGSTPVDPPLAD